MNFKILAAAVGIAMTAGATSASADLSTGGMFDRIDGPVYDRSAKKSYLGANPGNYKPRKKTAARRETPANPVVKVSAAPMAAAGVGPRPGKWCGWWMRTQLGGGPEFNVAWNWRKYGSPTTPQVGAVVVWRHHVGIITGRAANGKWIVKSGNDGGKVRERARSVAGAVFRI